MKQRSVVAFLALLAGVHVACSSSSKHRSQSTGADGSGGSGGGGEGGGAGSPDSSGGSGGSEASSDATGGSGGTTGDDCELLPDRIEEDLSVGPGCVRLDRSQVIDAELTIEPGTTVYVEPDGFLDVSPFDAGTLLAVGSEDEPIVFTSSDDDPQAGDWQCIRLGPGSSASELEFVTLEYGGQPCEATGADYEAMLDLASSVRRVVDVTITNSATHGVLFQHDANVRTFEAVTFADNEQPSILVHGSEILSLGQPLTFEDDDDYIEVDTTFSLGTSGDWHAQDVPFRIVGAFAINDMAQVVMEAGLTLEFTGQSFEIFNATLDVEGTEEAPVTFTSSANNPLAGDWGCVFISSPTGTPSFDYAVFEYAGSGAGCTGANYQTALNVTPGVRITNTVFREIAGTAIRISSECESNWCDNEFDAVEEGPLSCDLGTLTTCP